MALFCNALTDNGMVAETLESKSHNPIMVLMSARLPAGKAHPSIVKFIRKHSAQ